MSSSMYGSAPRIASDETAPDWPRQLAPLGPRRLKVIIDVSNKCNLRCRMCHFSFDDVFHRPAQHMSPKLFASIAERVLPHAHTLVLSAGNEPLMSPHFVDILHLIVPYEIPTVYFITNGQLLTDRVADAVLEAGVTQVQISVDGPTQETYEYIRRGARFETLLRNIGHLTAKKRSLGRALPLLQFNIVLMKRNLEELEHYVNLAEELGVEWIAARHLLQMRGLNMEAESLASDPLRANYYFRRFLRRAEMSKRVTIVSFPDLFEEPDAPDDEEEPADQAAEIPAPEQLPKPKRPIAMRVLREIRRMPRNVRLVAGPPLVEPAKQKKPLPRGAIDFPEEKTVTANNAVQLQGWASDLHRVRRVLIECDADAAAGGPINERGRRLIGAAKILTGTPPKLPGTFERLRHRFRRRWEFELRREQISSAARFEAMIHVVVENNAGYFSEIGRRQVTFAYGENATPYLFCSRPFDSVMIDSQGNVSPYPDCRVAAPFGSLTDADPFSAIWFGEQFTTLRRRIINRDPPDMCVTCAHFINSNVDDPAYFATR